MITKNTRLYLKFLLFLWIIAILFRVVFMIWQKEALSAFSAATVWKAFYIGVRFDGRVMLYASLLLAVFMFTPFLGRFFGATRKALLWVYTALFLVVFVSYAANFAHYAYLSLTVNWAAIDLLEDTKESFEMVWQTYPVIKIFLGAVLFVFICNRITRKIFAGWSPEKNRKRNTAVSGVLCVLVIAILIYGQYSINFFPLRWSEAYFSGYNEITALAQNPFHNIYDTRPTKGRQTYDFAAAQASYPLVAEYAGVQNPDPEKMRFDRFVSGSGSERPNVVFIFIESMSVHKSSFMFEELQTTPFLKSLSEESIYFPNYYATARTTAKATFSTVTGIPDANISFSTSSRDPWVVDQQVIWDEFDGYGKMFMMGGNANWANIRGVLSNNVPGLTIYEEGYWKSPRMDVWGISDYHLLQEAHEVFEKQQEPFFAMILTASFHRPFTVPDNLEGFDYSMPDDDFIRKYGFVDGEYQSMKFCDYAVREFFKAAKESDYYDNTIFVITGDHGISETSPSAGENYQKLRIHEFQVPLIIYYPKKLNPQIQTRPGGHVDIFPTIAGIAGIPYQNTTLGRDLLADRPDGGAWTFILRTGLPPALVKEDRLYIAGDGGEGTLYSRTPNAIAEDWLPMGEPDEDLERLRRLSWGIIDNARYLLYNNSKQEAEKAAHGR